MLPIRRAFGSLALLWPAVLVAATRIAAVPHRGAAAYLVSAAVYYTGSLLCHQRPERSFHFWGVQFPVCARCAGIYAGAAIGALVGMVYRGGTVRTSDRVVHLTALLAASVPTALTLVFEWTTGVTPANWVRALSGIVLGATAAIVVMRAGAASGREVN
jgi:uncharacterized membrane protein